MRFLKPRGSFEESTSIMNSIKETIMKLKGERFISRHVIFLFRRAGCLKIQWVF